MPDNENNTYEMVLKSATTFPLVRINRDIFLRKELSKFCPDWQVEKAVAHNPAYAGISKNIISGIAWDCINMETTNVTALSIVAGLPGGLFMIGTIPADLAQYYGHVLRILQKLVYLYGWHELFEDGEKLDDGTNNLLTLFLGIMFGVEGAGSAIAKIAEAAGQKTAKDLVNKALTKGIIYPIVKKIATRLGQQMTKEIYAKGIGKIIPFLGGVVSGTITFITYRPMAIVLKKHLSKLNIADPSFYKSSEGDTQIIE